MAQEILKKLEELASAVEKSQEQMAEQVATLEKNIQRLEEKYQEALEKSADPSKNLEGKDADEFKVKYFRGLYQYAKSGKTKVLKDLGLAPDNQGGIMVPKVVWDGVMQKVVEYGVLPRIARIVPMTSNEVTVPSIELDATLQQRDASGKYPVLNPSTGGVKLTAQEVGGIVKMEEAWLADINVDGVALIEELLAMTAARTFDFLGFRAATSANGGTDKFDGLLRIAGQTVNVGTEVDQITLDHLITAVGMIGTAPLAQVYHVLPAKSYIKIKTARGSDGHFVALNDIENAVGNLANADALPQSKAEASDTTSGDVYKNLGGRFGLAMVAPYVILGDRRDTRLKLLDQTYADEGKIGLRMLTRFSVGAAFTDKLIAYVAA